MPIGRLRLRIDRFFGRGRNRVEPDVGEKDDRRALVDAGEAVRRERVEFAMFRCVAPTAMKSASASELDHHHDVVGARALLRAAEQQPGDEHHDPERRQIDENRHAGDVRRGLQQPVDCRVDELRSAVRYPVVSQCRQLSPKPRSSVVK